MFRRQRILLIEFLGEDPFSHARAGLYPVTLGMARAARHDAHWVVIEAGGEARPSSPYVVELPTAERQLLVETVRQHEPTLVVLNERLGPKTHAALREATSGIVQILDGNTQGRLRLARLFLHAGRVALSVLDRGDAEGLQFDIQATEPDYGAEILNPGPLVGRHYTSIYGGHSCVYRKPGEPIPPTQAWRSNDEPLTTGAPSAPRA